MKDKIDSIIFDWDNTLFNFNKYWEIGHQKAYDEFGFNKFVSYDTFICTYKHFDNLLWKEVLKKHIGLDELRVRRLIYTLRRFNKSISEEDAVDFFKTFFQIMLDRIEPDDELIRKITILKKSYNLCILTNGKLEEQLEKIKRMRFEGFIPYYISEEIGYEKPDDGAFLFALNKLDTAPSKTLMIGDSLENDIKPASKLGMMTMHIGKEYTKYADYSFESIHEALDELIGRNG